MAKLDCELLETCPFFNSCMKNMPDHEELFKQLYCCGGKDLCARYMIYAKLGRPAIPNNLFPNEVTRAKALIMALKPAGKQA